MHFSFEYSFILKIWKISFKKKLPHLNSKKIIDKVKDLSHLRLAFNKEQSNFIKDLEKYYTLH